jgi:hypothetical protein
MSFDTRASGNAIRLAPLVMAARPTIVEQIGDRQNGYMAATVAPAEDV